MCHGSTARHVWALTAWHPRSLREGYAWAEDKEHCEEYGRMLSCDARKVRTRSSPACMRSSDGSKQVSQRAKKRGLPQMGTLGAGNHYAEIQARPDAQRAHLAHVRLTRDC